MNKNNTTYLKISQDVDIWGSSGGKSYSESKLRYTGPIEGFPSLPSFPSSTCAEKIFIFLFTYLEKRLRRTDRMYMQNKYTDCHKIQESTFTSITYIGS